MGFFSDIGDAFSDFASGAGEALFGTETKKEANKRAEEAIKKMGEVSETSKALQKDYAGQSAKLGKIADKYGLTVDAQGKLVDKYGKKTDIYDKQIAESLGTSAADYMAKQQAAAEAGAEKQGVQAATQGAQAALRAARAGGLSKGQAALAGAQQIGDIYSGAYSSGLESGKQQYTQGAQMQQAQGSELANRQATAASTQIGAQNAQQGAYGTQLAAMGGQNQALNTQLGAATGEANIAQNQYQNAANNSAQTLGTIGTIAGSAAMMLSDKNTKTNIIDNSSNKFKGLEGKKKFDKVKLSNAVTEFAKNIGNSHMYQSAPINTSGVNVAQNTTASGNDMLNKGIMNVASGAKSMMDKSKSTKGFSDASNALSSGEIGKVINKNSFSIGKTSSVLSDEQVKTQVINMAKDTTAGRKDALNDGIKNIISSEMMAKVIPMVMSDKNTKTDIKQIRDRLSKIDVKEIAKKIRPVSFEYKEGVEEIDPRAKPNVEHVGVIAQDLEKTALAPAVKTGEDGLKRIDIAELAPALLNMIVQQQAQIDELKKGIK